jgi:hypothetical protein
MNKCLMLQALLFAAVTSLQAQSYSIDRSEIAGGGGTSSNGQYTVSGTVGQHDPGEVMNGGAYSLAGGFWAIFALQTPGAPVLTVTFVGPDSVVISWSSSATGFVLQQNSDLNTTNWSDFGGTPDDNGTSKSVTISLPVGSSFFRLIKD